MEFIKVHIFKTENEAIKAIDLINKGEGIPINESATTRTYCEPLQLEDFWYIKADEVTQKYLTEVEEVEIKNML